MTTAVYTVPSTPRMEVYDRALKSCRCSFGFGKAPKQDERDTHTHDTKIRDFFTTIPSTYINRH